MNKDNKNFFFKTKNKAKIAIFISGSGTNAEKILEYQNKLGKKANFETICLITDCPKSSNAYLIAKKFNLSVIGLGIKDFYKKNNLNTTSIASKSGQQVRQLWTNELIKLIEPFKIDFGVFAGFVPLTNITTKLTCLNIHPGDLTYERDGKRKLIGLHTLPIRRCIEENLDYMASTVIIVNSYENDSNNMDNGVILAMSPKIKLDLPKNCNRQKMLNNPQKLSIILNKNLQQLKENGDWKIFPAIINDFAKGIFAISKNSTLLISINGYFMPFLYIKYNDQGKKEIIFKN